MKILITGCSGFVGYYFMKHLVGMDKKINVLGIDFKVPEFDFNLNNVGFTYSNINLMNGIDVYDVLSKFSPDYILHLASFSSVGLSWKSPIECFHNNTNIILYLLEAVRKAQLNCRILSIGSSEEYGNVKAEAIPLTEESLLDPVSPYAVARVSQELLSKVYIDGYGLDIIMTRSFNHIGPKQNNHFVIPSFAHQMAKIKHSGTGKGVLTVGNIDIIRDFLDVRDVVEAYSMLLEEGVNGEVYNVCSGEGHSLKGIIQIMAEAIGIKVKIIVDNKLIRPQDNMIIVGSNDKILQGIGWKRKIGLEESLRDIANHQMNLL